MLYLNRLARDAGRLRSAEDGAESLCGMVVHAYFVLSRHPRFRPSQRVA